MSRSSEGHLGGHGVETFAVLGRTLAQVVAISGDDRIDEAVPLGLCQRGKIGFGDTLKVFAALLATDTHRLTLIGGRINHALPPMADVLTLAAAEELAVLRHRHPVERLSLLRSSRCAGDTVMSQAIQSVQPIPRRLRCAIYTRKSSEEGLDMEFNSLDAQREACEAYVTSQRCEGWATIRERYDDGGFSGGTLERPGLKQLLTDIEDGLIDVIVVYKIDRLSRSLMDFARLVEIFDRHSVTFVSVTQSFNTTTSMGRLTLNILLSFAQFEREVIGERIRDKVAASRKRGMWMGGWAPMGYDVKDRKLVINQAEAATVRQIFERFVELGSATVLATELADKGVRNKRGRLIDKGFLYKLLNNRVYIGEAVHKGTGFPGEHQAIIDQGLWDSFKYSATSLMVMMSVFMSFPYKRSP